MVGEDADQLSAVVARALAEDVGTGDVTSRATVPAGARARARIVQKQPGVVFGLAAVAETMRQCGVDSVDNLIVEGQWRDAVPADVALAVGPAAGLLAAERTALNLLGHLSGVATQTARFVEAVAGTGARILDTRKTTPGLRALEKQAVAAGGGVNHRLGLFDAILIKENHIALAGGLAEAVAAARAAEPDLAVEVECRDLTTSRPRLRPGPIASCSTTWIPMPCARRSRCVGARPRTGTAPPSRPRGASTFRVSARSPRRGSS